MKTDPTGLNTMSEAMHGAATAAGVTLVEAAKARRKARDDSGVMYVDGSIYEGMEACLVRSGRTVAHVVKYADAVEIAAALTPPLAMPGREEQEEWAELMRNARASALVKADLADHRAFENERRATKGDDLSSDWGRYAAKDRIRANRFRAAADRILSLIATPEGEPLSEAEELPDVLAGHWDTAEGRVMAESNARVASQSFLTKGDVSDFALANAVFMADRNDLDLLVWQTAAKERIRWLSARLAAMQHTPAASAPSKQIAKSSPDAENL